MPRLSRYRQGLTPGQARDILEKDGPPAIVMLCKIASGRPIFRRLKGGVRQRIDPSMDQVIDAAKFVVSRLVPELKATEFTGLIETRSDGSEHDPRQVGRAILAVLGQGLAGEAPQSGTHDTTKALEYQDT